MADSVRTDGATAHGTGCLDGLTVLEHGGVAAAYAAKMLADFGADVVTLEGADGDPLRDQHPHVPDLDGAGPAGMYRYLRTNRRVLQGSTTADGLRELLRRCRVLVTDVSDADRTEVGLGTAELRRAHPHLLVVTISPFGGTGPMREMAGGELIAYAAGGLAQTSPGLPDGVDDAYIEGPLHPGGYPASIIAGLTAAVAALSALPRSVTGEGAEGDHLDVSGQAAVASMVSRYLSVTAYDGVVTDRSYPGPLNMPNLYLPCRDGYVVIAAILDHQWHRLVEAMGSPDWARDLRYATAAGRNADRDEIESRLREWCLKLDGEDIVRLATTHGVPCFRFYRLDEMENSSHVVARRSLIEVPGSDGRQMPGAPFVMSASPWQLRSPAPADPTTLDEILASAAWGGEPIAGGSGGARRRPLEGIRVLDFGQVLAVPFGTQWMAWLGADVILVESENHLHTRATPPFATDDRDADASAVFNLFNGGKRSLTVDLKTDQGREVLYDLVPHCDIVVENFRAGVLDRLGLSFDHLQGLRQDIILLSLGAFGRSGPMADGAGLHSAANLFSGLADVTRYPGGGPRIMGACLPDPISGLNALLAVLLALHHRARTGQGQYIDQAMYESLLPLCAGAIMADEVTRASMRSRGSQGDDALFSGFFPSSTYGEWLTIEVATREDWERLLDEVGFRAPDDGADPTDSLLLSRVRAAIVHWLGDRSLDEATAALRSRSISAVRASSTSDILQDEQLRAIGYVRAVDHPVAGRHWVPTLPWRTDASDDLLFERAPLLGEHVEPILTGLLGYELSRVRELQDEGVLR